MFFQRVAELAFARAVHARYEIQEFAVGRLGGGIQCGAAGQGDGRGREAVARVGVVGRVALQIGAADFAVICAAHAVNHGGVGLQAHVHGQAVAEHGGHIAAVFFVCGFLFNQAGHNQQFIRRFIGQVVGATLPGSLQIFLHGAVCRPINRHIARIGRHFVSIGEKQAFGVVGHGFGSDFLHQFFIRPVFRVVPQQRVLVDDAAHLGKAHAFHNLNAHHVRPRAAQPPHDFPCRHARRQAVAARCQLVLRAVQISCQQHAPARKHLLLVRQLTADRGKALSFFHREPIRHAVVFRYEHQSGRHGNQQGNDYGNRQ